VYCEESDAAPGVPVATMDITFDEKGHCTVPPLDVSFALAVDNGSQTPLQWSIDMTGLSQLQGNDTADLTYQDGLPLGTLESFSVDRSGAVFGAFTNGSTRQLGQVALAVFNNAAGLNRMGGNVLSESPNSGTPQLGLPGSGSRGLLSAGFLEASNVDLATEFANMIVAQRGFQASSRIITVSDEVLQDLVALKR